MYVQFAVCGFIEYVDPYGNILLFVAISRSLDSLSLSLSLSFCSGCLYLCLSRSLSLSAESS